MDKDLMQTLEYFIRYPADATPGKIRGFLMRFKRGIEDSERVSVTPGAIDETALVIHRIAESCWRSRFNKAPMDEKEWEEVVGYIARELHFAARHVMPMEVKNRG